MHYSAAHMNLNPDGIRSSSKSNFMIIIVILNTNILVIIDITIIIMVVVVIIIKCYDRNAILCALQCQRNFEQAKEGMLRWAMKSSIYYLTTDEKPPEEIFMFNTCKGTKRHRPSKLKIVPLKCLNGSFLWTLDCSKMMSHNLLGRPSSSK